MTTTFKPRLGRVTRDWSVGDYGRRLVLRMDLVIEGQQLRSEVAIDENLRYTSGGVPFDYVERHMKRQMMSAVESAIFGGQP